MARIDRGRARLFTRGGHDWTNKLESLASEVEKLGITEAWLDGELVVLKDGLPDFNALQNAITGLPVKAPCTFFSTSLSGMARTSARCP